ncbi:MULTISPECIES: pyridoxal-phosphate-dependent aminotransferase family protein [Shewanella]|jgi:alanine-glyoxylate transaminase/serine-glyoxylate transaminase/serine-pyruvate transaminase|uniref:Serine--pyruvate aminotransferase n=4 Tax=Bacteria TaxID=2 RepID=A0AAD1KE29_9GAMM|nr:MULTISPECIES: alanine--glyoxylate aminotransferase family protein [Shewanella]AXQ13806.1 alanine--glyoxylate aminotransferase [Shewanella algae]EKT4488452.1 alanine--glyoxylate aminotransferase family protein [Shewanella algae]MBO2549939.1 alanine--glyoxylate aminotransferase family protein [Shewanella algae]MBO2584229.1 alanine--glyoxylate aminotransferase family protein [Shewanella algae]MBO2592712.1 alanine--glyoxylate aminotransferase family protein [Shewanella algae]
MFAAPSVSAFNPPRRILMGPGPSDVYPQVLAAQSRPTVGHLDPLFVAMMDELKSLIQYAFQTRNEMTIAVSAPGSAGMETCFVNLVEPGEKVIVCRNGVFGDRMRQNVERIGAEAVMLDFEWGTAVDPEVVEAALKAHPDAAFLAFVHAETSTGALSDAKTLCALAREHGCLSIVDAVTSLGGVELRVDDWGIDAIYSGSQKCLSCVPGLSPVSFSPAAVAKLKARKSPVQSWFLDQSLVMGYWSGDGKRSYHHTAPVNALYSLHEALRLLAEEGLENAWQRHRDMHLLLRQGLESMGLEFVVAEQSRLPQLNAVYIPQGVDDGAVRKQLLDNYNLEIGAGLGALAGKAWRIGLMGYGARRENVALCLRALAEVLN